MHCLSTVLFTGFSNENQYLINQSIITQAQNTIINILLDTNDKHKEMSMYTHWHEFVLACYEYMILWIGGNVTERQMCIKKKLREPLMFDMILYWDKYLQTVVWSCTLTCDHINIGNFFLTRYHHQGSWTSSTKLVLIKYQILFSKVLDDTETICASVAILIQKKIFKK